MVRVNKNRNFVLKLCTIECIFFLGPLGVTRGDFEFKASLTSVLMPSQVNFSWPVMSNHLQKWT